MTQPFKVYYVTPRIVILKKSMFCRLVWEKYVKKTKEMIIDFRLTKNPMRQLEIKDESVETVGCYKYLGFTIDNKLNWHAHIDVLCNKLNTRLFFLKKLKSFHGNESILKMFYLALIQSVITFGISCWGGNITEGDKQKTNRSIKKAGKIVGEELPLLNDLYKKKLYHQSIKYSKWSMPPSLECIPNFRKIRKIHYCPQQNRTL